MKCPRCNADLKNHSVNGVNVPFCEAGHGFFTSKGKLDSLSPEHDGDLEYSTVEGDSFKHNDSHPFIACPSCENVEMKKVNFNILTDIILDWCPQCQGFWIDQKDFQAIEDEIEHINKDKRDGKPVWSWMLEIIRELPI